MVTHHRTRKGYLGIPGGRVDRVLSQGFPKSCPLTLRGSQKVQRDERVWPPHCLRSCPSVPLCLVHLFPVPFTLFAAPSLPPPEPWRPLCRRRQQAACCKHSRTRLGTHPHLGCDWCGVIVCDLWWWWLVVGGGVVGVRFTRRAASLFLLARSYSIAETDPCHSRAAGSLTVKQQQCVTTLVEHVGSRSAVELGE